MDLAKHVMDTMSAMNRMAAQSLQHTKALSHTELETRCRVLEQALRPFVASYQKHSDPIGDSDLDNEQLRDVLVTLGACRNAARVLLGGQ